MRLKQLLTTIIICSASALAQAANVCDSGVGGTGIILGNQQDFNDSHIANGTGIGGTGITPQNKLPHGTGIGGTGQQADNTGVGGTGIIGVVTGFASICVNGVEAHYDANTYVDIDGSAGSIEDIAIGQVVAIDATGRGREVKAKNISVIHSIVGKVQQVNNRSGEVRIMNQTVKLSPNTLGNSRAMVGQTLKISGLRDESGTIHAVRTDIASADTPSMVTGLADKNNRIAGVPVQLPRKVEISGVVRTVGDWDGNTLHAKEVKLSAIETVLKEGHSFHIQDLSNGYLAQKSLRVQGKEVAISKVASQSRGQMQEKQSVILRGQVERNGKLTSDQVEYVRKDNILERGGSKDRPKSSNRDAPQDRKQNKDEKPGLGQEKEKREHNHPAKKPDFAEKREKSERAEKPEHMEKPEHVEKPESIEKLERIEKPESIEKPERIEKPESIEKPEHFEKPESLERDD